jgi:hypothetical protein
VTLGMMSDQLQEIIDHFRAHSADIPTFQLNTLKLEIGKYNILR